MLPDDPSCHFAPPMPGGPQPDGHGIGLSTLLDRIASQPAGDRISVGDLLAALKDRAYGALLLVFAAPNVLPTPPGTSTVLGAPLLFLAAQLAIGRPVPWLPALIADRSVDRGDFANLVGRLVPWLARAERLLRPRLTFLAAPPVERMLGAVCLLLAAVLVLPIPLGNMLPALAICLLALAVLERDGVMALCGLLLAAVSMVIVSGVVYAFILSAIIVMERLFMP